MLLAQTNWPKMPARELGSSFESSNGARNVGTTLLKKHRILPHPREHISEQLYTPTPAGKARDLVIDTDHSSHPSSDTSSPKTLKHASKRIGGLPPTPPTHSRQSSGNQASITSAPRFDLTSIKAPSFVTSSPGTPPNKHSPPTPDVTPPKSRAHLPFRPSISDRNATASSRADSFRTAQENIESEDDDEVTVRPTLHSARQSENSVIRIPSRVQKRKEVGLGLGLESEGTTTPRQGRRSQQEFVVFDGDWVSGGETSEVEKEWDDNLMRNVTVRKRPRRNFHMDGTTDDVIEDNIVTPTLATRALRSQPLQERIARHRLERDTADRRSTEKFAERIEWPPAVADPESPVAPEIRRFSVMSGRSVNSTVVEAMVVEAPPIRRKTLRHTKKLFGLRDFSSDQSTTNSVVSSEPPIQLHHSRGRLPARRHESLASNTTVSTASTSRSRRQILKDGGIPVVVIPDRRSSNKSSRAPSLRSTSSRRTKRSASMTSAPLSHSSKFNEPEYFDRRPVRRRTMSESETSSQSVRTIDFPPTIPARRSSLSAPTSRNGSRAPSLAPSSRDTSRAGSLTAESLKAHNMIQAKKQPPAPAPQSQPSESHRDTNHRHHQLSVDHNGDPFFGTRLSTQVTPFSQYSYETAGTMAELSEAQAVELYPHQNKSLLVVEHQPSPPSLEPLDTTSRAPPTMALNGTAADGPATPPQPRHPMDEVDSPLRNPRDPPEPPAIKFIPPTPAGLTPGHEEDRQLGYDPNERPLTSEKPKRPGSLMRRAFSNSRRISEPSQPGFLKRTFSLSNNRRRDEIDEATQTSKPEANPSTMYPSVEDRPPEATKLHPFWKPAHFWDDLEDDDEDSDEFGGRYPMIDNRPKPKRTLSEKMKRTFAILPIEDDDDERYNPVTPERRIVKRSASGNMRVVKQRSRASLQRQASAERRALSDETSGEQPFGYNFKEGNGGHNYRGYTIPGLGLRVEYVGFSGLKRRISERRREQRSDRLRGSISAPRGVKSGIDDVLRRRNTRG